MPEFGELETRGYDVLMTCPLRSSCCCSQSGHQFAVCSGESSSLPPLPGPFCQTGMEGASFVLTGMFFFTHVPPRHESQGFL